MTLSASIVDSMADGVTGAINGGIAFSDIVASTELVERIGDEAWLRLLGEQHDATRSLAEERGVEVVGCVGDGFLLQSVDSHRLVATGIALQRVALAQRVPLRMGMHFGGFYYSFNTLVGLDVHVAARLTDVARANEIVLSNEIAQRAGLVGRSRVRMLRGVSRPCRYRILSIDKEPH